MKISIKNHLIHAELSSSERREVLEDLFVFGKSNQKPFLIRMSVLLVLSTIIATAGLLSDSAAMVLAGALTFMACGVSPASAWPIRSEQLTTVEASCGTRKGKYSTRGRSIEIEMGRFNWFGCRKDENLKVFLGDLQRSTSFFIDDGQLQISMSTDSGIMYFRKK